MKNAVEYGCEQFFTKLNNNIQSAEDKHLM